MAAQPPSPTDVLVTPSATTGETPPTPADETIEAVEAVMRAAVDVGRQLLDAVERALDDPATAERLAEVVGGLSALFDGLRRVVPGPGGGPPPRSDEVEHIEVS